MTNVTCVCLSDASCPIRTYYLKKMIPTTDILLCINIVNFARVYVLILHVCVCIIIQIMFSSMYAFVIWIFSLCG